eukprot:GHVR01134676.1.p1 GENE.GHVR01134676.1~~GHVR01134676.1.p1  ORF type:complete len:283 (-),score=76.32 GHVR01134676.1:190-1008(-)
MTRKGSKKKDKKNANLPFMRITLLGCGGCGKTCLINNYINNYCPNNYNETHWPEYYYKLLKIPSDDGSDEFSSVVVEIEDTYACTRGDANRNIQRFLNLDRKEINVSKGAERTPFSLYKEPIDPGDTYKDRSLSTGRMGFLIIFDVTDESSWDAAIELHRMLVDEVEKRRLAGRDPLVPEIFMVANKIDKDRTGDCSVRLLEHGENYCEQQELFFCRVSAMTGKNVHKMFETLVKKLKHRETLWTIADEEEEEEDEESDNDDKTPNQDCSLM